MGLGSGDHCFVPLCENMADFAEMVACENMTVGRIDCGFAVADGRWLPELVSSKSTEAEIAGLGLVVRPVVADGRWLPELASSRSTLEADEVVIAGPFVCSGCRGHVSFTNLKDGYI